MDTPIPIGFNKINSTTRTMLISIMLTEPAVTAEVHIALRAPWNRTVAMIFRSYMLLPAIERHVVLITIIFATAAGAGAGAGTGDKVDGASGGIVDGDIRGGLAVKVDGAGVV